MSVPLVVAAVLMVLLGAQHSYLGERYILIRLFRRSDLPKLFGGDAFTKQTLRFAWHLTTAAWCGLAALLVQLAQPEVVARQASLRIIAATFGVSSVVSLVGSRGRHLSWVVFAVVSVLTWVASGNRCATLLRARGHPRHAKLRSNKAMKLTKLSPAPGRMERRLMPAKAHYCAGTASQLIAGVRRTRESSTWALVSCR